MALSFPPIFLLPAHLQPEQLLELEEKIPSLTYDIHEAELILGRVSKPERARFELRRAKLETEPVEHHDDDEVVSRTTRSPTKKRKLDESGLTEQRGAVVRRKPVKVLRLQWLTDSLEHGTLLPVADYLVYEGIPTQEREAAASSEVKLQGKRILERAAISTANSSSHGSKRYGANRTEKHSRSQRPALLHESTLDHDVTLPPIPDFLHTTYSCQRPTLVNPANGDFVDELKEVRTLRLLQGDQIGVRAYSTSIAALAAYPYPLKNAAGTHTSVLKSRG
jgi:DNA polymerase IV